MAIAQTPQFKKAIDDSRKLKAKPNNDELLQVSQPAQSCQTQPRTSPLTTSSQLYGLFKQGSQDPPFEKTTAPGMFEMKVGLERFDICGKTRC